MPHLRRRAAHVAAAALLLAACRPAPPDRLAPDRVTEAEAAARAAVANEQALAGAALPERTVGVAPLAVHAADTALTALGYGLADLLVTDLSRSAQLQVVDRIRMDALLREIGLVHGGRVDSSSAPRVGRLVAARQLLLGALSQLPSGELRIDARIANVGTGELRLALSARAPLAALLDLEKALAFELFDQLGVVLTPAERAAVEQRPTKSIAALLAYSRGVRSEATGDYGGARTHFLQAAQLDPGFGAAQARAALPGGQGGRAPQRAPGQQRLTRAAALAAGRVNPSVAQRLTNREHQSATAAGPEFTDAQLASVVILIRILP